jgi:shikimate dehydrogenase
MISKKNILGLVGKSLKHSYSATLFNKRFQDLGFADFNYALFELNEIGEFKNLLQHETDLKGFNVTIPYKQEIIPFLDELDETAQKTGVVNTVSIEKFNGKILLKGYNTDYLGFKKSIKPLLRPEHERALILGKGATSNTVAHVLQDIGIDVLFVSRNKNDDETILWDEINNYVIEHHKLIINTSPLGMFPDVDIYPDIPYQHISSEHLIYDVVYNPEKTQFLSKAELQGAQIQNGFTMLQLQAEEAWKIWKGIHKW